MKIIVRKNDVELKEILYINDKTKLLDIDF
jgi:hypothetical protein